MKVGAKDSESYLYLAKIFKIEEDIRQEEKNIKTTLLLDPKNEEAMFLLIDMELERSNFSKGENWNLNVSLRYSTNRVDPINPRNTFWANSNLSFRFGGGWQVRYNARLNLIEKDLGVNVLDIKGGGAAGGLGAGMVAFLELN